MSERILKALAVTDQGLDTGKKLTACKNIGAIGGVKVISGGATTELVPDSEQKVTVDLDSVTRVQSDWDEVNPVEPSYIRNKPDIAGLVSGVFIGEPGFTPFADFKAAWEAGRAIFLRREIDSVEYLYSMDSITDNTIEFTRSVGTVDGGTYTAVKAYIARVTASTPSDLGVWVFHEKDLDQVQANWEEASSSSKAYIRNKPNLATVATSGEYNDLLNKPTIPAAQIQSDWTQTNTSSADYIKNKPSIPAAQIQSDWTQSDNQALDYIKNKPSLATVATSGNYMDLTNRPTIPAAQIQSDWDQGNQSSADYIKNKPNLAAVATSGSYRDLTNKPDIPSFARYTSTKQGVAISAGSYTTQDDVATFTDAIDAGALFVGSMIVELADFSPSGALTDIDLGYRCGGSSGTVTFDRISGKHTYIIPMSVQSTASTAADIDFYINGTVNASFTCNVKVSGIIIKP